VSGRLGFVAAITVLALAGSTMPASAEAPPLPNSMAAIGDSITRAVDACCIYGDHPHKSWATGDIAGDSVLSQYERILAGNPAIAGFNFNDSEDGAKMDDAPGQAAVAVGQSPEYVAILMGGNDLCTPTIEEMTSVEDFRSQFQTTMDTLGAGLPPNAHIFVSSIPNVYLLWKNFRWDPIAQAIWALAGICQSLLSTSNNEEDRQAVATRNRELNDVLAEVCAQYANCLFDGYAVFNFRFTKKDVS